MRDHADRIEREWYDNPPTPKPKEAAEADSLKKAIALIREVVDDPTPEDEG